jgi:hypothetical protein
MSLSYHSLLADVYWIRAVQVYGGTPTGTYAGSRATSLLYPLLDLTTSLDPYFDVPTSSARSFLAECAPGGPGGRSGDRLAREGRARQPGRLAAHQAIGFVHYWSYQDYAAAADWFSGRRACRRADWMEPLAAVTLAEGGNRNASRLMWQQILRTRHRRLVPQRGRAPLKQLDAMDQMDTLTRVVATFTARQGRPPANWAEWCAPDTSAAPSPIPAACRTGSRRRGVARPGLAAAAAAEGRRGASVNELPPPLVALSSQRSAWSSAASSTCASTGCR